MSDISVASFSAVSGSAQLAKRKMDFRFRKAERITSLKDIEHLFERGCSSSVNVSPLLAVWQQRPAVTADGRRSVKVLAATEREIE